MQHAREVELWDEAGGWHGLSRGLANSEHRLYIKRFISNLMRSFLAVSECA